MTDAPDPRPRPQYGEYATPEEQRARIVRPDPAFAGTAPDAQRDEPSSRRQPRPASPSRDTDSQRAGSQRAGSPPPAAASTATRASGGLADRIATVALLAYGLFSVVNSIVAFADFGAYTETLLGMIGVDASLADPAGARPWGIAAGIVLGIGWLLTAMYAWQRMRRGRLTFWIPLVGAVVFNMLAAVLMVVPLLSDPAIVDAILEAAP